MEDLVGCTLDGGGDDGSPGGEGEPALFFFELAGVVGVDFAAGAHEAGADSGDADALVAEFGVEALGEADEGELAGDVGKKMRHGELAADAGDVDDCSGATVEHVRKRGLGGVDGGEEVGGHGSAIGGERLIFDRADFDDAGVVDEDVDVAEVGDGMLDEGGGLGGVGEVGWDDENVVGGVDGAAAEEGVSGGAEFVVVAGGEDEFGPGAAVTVGKCEAKAAGASGDEDDLLSDTSIGAGAQGIGGSCGGDAGEELGGVECGR